MEYNTDRQLWEAQRKQGKVATVVEGHIIVAGEVLARFKSEALADDVLKATGWTKLDGAWMP